MKYLILFITLFYSCRTIKDRSVEQQRNLTVENRQSHAQWSLYDSTSQSWYFHSDSAFYYHPNHGLYGRGGVLSVSQDQVRSDRGQQSVDSTHYLLDERSKADYSSKTTPLWYKWIAIVVGTVVILLLILRIRGRR